VPTITALDGFHVADATTQLNGRAHHIQDRGHRIVVHRIAFECAIEINDVQRLETHCRKTQRLIGWVVVE